MKSVVPLLLVWQLAACGGGLSLQPVEPKRAQEIAKRCTSIYPVLPWRATHVVEVTLATGQAGSFLGVVAADAPHKFRVILVSPEGFVVFDATYDQGNITANRAVPPLDSEQFARGMAGDIRLMLFAPSWPLVEAGHTEAGAESCRFERADGQTVQVVLESPERAHLLLYAANGALDRDGVLRGPRQAGFFQEMLLVAQGPLGYSLAMRLMDSEVEDKSRALSQTTPEP